MANPSADLRHLQLAQAKHARACKTGDPVQIKEALREITAAKLRRAVNDALTAEYGIPTEERERLAALLMGGAHHATT